MGVGDRIAGKDVYATFGTQVISGDYTSVDFGNEADLVDVTAGAETSHYYLPLGRTDGQLTIESYYGGTVVRNALAAGNAGTLIVQPRGTAAGMPKYTWSRVLVLSNKEKYPFDNAVTVTDVFQFSSQMVVGTN